MANDTRNIYLQGKAKWAKLVTPDTKYGSQWSVVLYPNPESYQTILDLKEKKDGLDGIMNTIKHDEDGFNIQLKRQTSKTIRGKVVGFAPPEVLESDGTTVLRNALVGNGSDITCKIQYYTYPKPAGGRGSAIRLESVRVDNLVPFEMSKDFDQEQQRQVKGLPEQPPQPLF